MVVTAFVGGAPIGVAFDLVRASLRSFVLRAPVARADPVAAQGLPALALVTLHVASVVDQGIPGRTVVGVAGYRS